MFKRATGEININSRAQASTKQVAIPDANSVMVLIVFRVKDTRLSSF